MFTIAGVLLLFACGLEEAQDSSPTARAEVEHRSNVPPLDATNIVSIASGSEDHTTLVAAIQAADYVTSVAASGPLTVFAPIHDARVVASIPASNGIVHVIDGVRLPPD